jgi:NCAIR mutase (PurE)-related protein
VIKSFLIESISDVESIDQNVQSTNSSSDDENQHLASEISKTQSRLIRARRLSLRYQNFADITVFLQDDVDSSSSTSILISTFVGSSLR